MICCGSKRTQFRPPASHAAAAKRVQVRGPAAWERETESSLEQEFAPHHNSLGLQATAGNQALQAFFHEAGAASATHTPLVGARAASEGSPFDTGLRREMEARIGGDFSQIRIHADEQAGGSAQRLGTLAYAVGSHVSFAPGRFAPETPEGRHAFNHAWLILGNRFGVWRAWFQVY